MKIFYVLHFFSFLETIHTQYLISVDSFFQTKETILALNGEITNDFGIVFGIWSKYNPLNKISQGGIIGMMDSNCFHYMNFIRESFGQLELLYYDCLYPESQTIQRILAYNTEDGLQHVHKVEIDPFEYENVWYLFELLYSPSANKLEVIMVKEDQFLLHKLLNVNIIKTENLILTIGSDLIVQNSNIESIEVGSKFSYFPGQLKLLKVNQKIITKLDPQILGKAVFVLFFDTISEQQCKQNNQYFLLDQDITWLDTTIFLSQNVNTNSFTFSGWYKIKEIHQIDDKFTYQFLRIMPNFENDQFSNPNLSPFQLSYKISSNKNTILITTYSYQFPSITLDFTNIDNAFIISKEFEILHKFTFWHYLLVKLVDDEIFISIKFYDSLVIYEYSDLFNVKQFNNLQFKLLQGNLEKSSLNYINIQTRNQYFYNCQFQIEQKKCHHSCKECDGPTETDCLSCPEESSRIYKSQYKSCICPHQYYDDKVNQNCKSYSDLQLIINEMQIENGCKFGYFEYDDSCYACPSIISNQLTTCLECIQNVKGWKQNSYCQTTLYINRNGYTVKTISEEDYHYYLFDGSEFSICRFCDQQSLSNLDNLYQDFNLLTSKFMSFCQFSKKIVYTSIIQDICFECNLPNCSICSLEITEIRCIQCKISFNLINGICTNKFEVRKNSSCIPPLYKNSTGECKPCKLANCKYCFEFNKIDLSKSTLYAGFDIFDLDENLVIGCALCEENFNYDFTIGECLYKQSSLPNCIRSFINLENQEICTLSSTDFNIAPEIINCNKFIQNCLQCLLTPQSAIKCIICQSGFTSSINLGNCYPNSFANAKVVIEGQTQIFDAWVQRVQSFMMKFLPNQYFYLRPYDEQTLIQFQVECKEGYRLNVQQDCKKYCTSDCLKCVQSINSDFFTCAKCPLNQYYQPILSEAEGSCLECAELCEVCERRSEAEIYKLNPNFKISEINRRYTNKCIRKISNPNVLIDPYLLIPKYCFVSICNQEMIMELANYFDIDSQVNVQYCNQIGINNISILINYKNDIDHSNLVLQNTELKSKIFSLRFIKLVLTFYENIFNSVILSGFDYIEINDAHFQFKSQDHIQFENKKQLVFLILKNIVIQQSSISNVNSIFDSDIFGDITLNNILIMGSNFNNASFFNFKLFSGIIKIEKMILKQCNFTNSQLFQLFNNQIKMHIEKLEIIQCRFVNSSFITFIAQSISDCQFELNGIQLTSNHLYQSYFLNFTNNFQLQLIDFILEQNWIEMSTIIGFSSNLTLQKNQIIKNQFINSYFLSGMQIDRQRIINCQIENQQIYKNTFRNSNLFYVESGLTNKNLYVQLISLIFSQNQREINEQQQITLFKIHCFQIDIQNVQIINSNNFRIFQLFEITKLFASNIVYKNLEINYKVKPNLNCAQNNYYVQNQLLFIYGFDIIIIKNITIYQQLSIDQSLLQILSSRNNISFYSKTLQLIDLQFLGNLLMKQFESSISTLITIESEQTTHIKLQNVVFLRNFLHSYIDISQEVQIHLIQIISLAGLIEINRLSCQNNALTNSSSSFISLKSKIILLTNYSISNLNVLPQELWNFYYDFSIDMAKFDQEQINFFIEQIFTIKSKGGAVLIIASTFSCFNCLFVDIIGQKSSIFQIRSQEDGNIQFINLTIRSIEYDLSQVVDSSGCITIDSSNSLLNLQILNAVFLNIFNRMAASIFTIFPSLRKNEVNIQDTQIINSISLKDTIINLQFSSQSMNYNKVILRNMTIQQEEYIWIKYFEKIERITQSEIQDLTTGSNSLIQLKNSKVIMQNILIKGLFGFTLIKLINISKLFIYQFQVIDIQTFSQFSLFELKQDLLIKQTIEIKFFQFQQFKIYEYQDESLIYKPKIKYISIDCDQMENNIQNSVIYNFQDFLLLMYHNWGEQRSIIDIQTLSNQTIFYLQNILFSNVACLICTNGIFYLKMENYSSIIIRDLTCNQNTILYYGCLNIVSQIPLNSNIKIWNSNFLSNFGREHGVGLFVSNISTRINQCKIVNNTAKGVGNLFLQMSEQTFKIQDSIITNNDASHGAGIYFSGFFNINQENFIKTFLLFNSEEYYSNNLFEYPTHLSLLINSQEMKSDELQINNITVRKLLLKPYKIIEQGVSKMSSYLMIPSDQALKEYKIYIPSLQISQNIFDDFQIQLKNSKNELMMNVNQLKCQISQTNLELNQDFLLTESKVIAILETNEDDSFDLGSISFHQNPYQVENQSIQILIDCYEQSSKNHLYYVIKALTYKCQLGEFFVDEGCQICESIFGYYSVTYNAAKCSIFDKIKFANITSNSIQLLEGYWRPNLYSDDTEICLKNVKFCKGGWVVGNEICIVGHFGGLCEECDSHNIRGEGQYFKNQQNAQCFSCSTNTITPFIFASLWAIFMILITLRSIEKSNLLFFACKLNFKPSISKILFKLGQDMESIFIKMVLNYLWIFSVIFTFNINFSISLSFIEPTSNASQFLAFSLDCFLSNTFKHELIYIRIIATFLLILLQFIIIQLGYTIFTLFANQRFQTSFISNTLLYLYVSNYSGLIKQFCSIVSTRLISNIQYIQGDLSLLYGSQNHQQWLYLFAIPGLTIFGFIIPLFFFFLLLMKKGQLGNIKFRRHTCYLFNEYDQKGFFWEQIKFLKKTSIILVMTYFESNILFKASLLGLCLLVYQLLAGKQQPYILSSLNALDLQTGQICSIAIFIATAKYVSEQQTNNSSSQILQILLIILFIKLCSLFIFDILRGYAKKYQVYLLTLIYQILETVKPNSEVAKYLNIVLMKLKQKQIRLKSNFSILKISSKQYIQKQKCNRQGNQNQSLAFKYQQYETTTAKYLLTIEQ